LHGHRLTDESNLVRFGAFLDLRVEKKAYKQFKASQIEK